MSEHMSEDAEWAKQTIVCRQIVKTISDFGVNDFQRLKIIELLGLELENREESLAIVETAKRLFETRESETKPQRRILT